MNLGARGTASCRRCLSALSLALACWAGATAQETPSPPGAAPAEAMLEEGRLRARTAAGYADLEEARELLRRVWLRFPLPERPRLEARSRALLLDGRIALRLGLDRQAGISFLEVVEREPDSRWSAAAHLGLAEALLRGGDWQAAADSLQTALESEYADPDVRADARRRLTLIHRRLLRPLGGGSAWQETRLLRIAGAELRRPAAVAADASGRLLVLDEGADQLLLVADDGGAVERRWPARGGRRPSWNGDVPLLAAGDSVVLPETGSELRFGEPGSQRTIGGLLAVEVGSYGDWYLLGRRGDGLYSYAADRQAGRIVPLGEGEGSDLARDGRGRLYVLDRRRPALMRLDPDTGGREFLVRGSWRRPAAVAVDGLGHLYVLDAAEGRIHVYDGEGGAVEQVGPLLPGGFELRRPADLTVAGDGRLFIVDERLGLVVLE